MVAGGFVALFEEAGRLAKEDLWIALHPENVAAQHQQPLTLLESKCKQLLKILSDPTNEARLIGQLDETEREAYLETQELLNAEEKLLSVAAERYASRIPLV